MGGMSTLALSRCSYAGLFGLLLAAGCGDDGAATVSGPPATPTAAQSPATISQPAEPVVGAGGGSSLPVGPSALVPEEPAPPMYPRRCHPPEQFSQNPTTVTEAVDWINAVLAVQGAPLDLLCVLESFHRPLHLFATSSQLSAQPADGWEDPRLFLFTGGMVTGAGPEDDLSNPVGGGVGVGTEPEESSVTEGMSMSVVATGVGRPFLELGELTSVRRSIKAEIEFPIEEPLGEHSPYETLEFGVVTTCGLCHTVEEPVFGIPNAAESDAFRPDPSLDVELATVLQQHAECDAEKRPDRCAFLDSIFHHGDVLHQGFPDEMPTIFERGRELEIIRQLEMQQQ